jgi:hypothetical protein
MKPGSACFLGEGRAFFALYRQLNKKQMQAFGEKSLCCPYACRKMLFILSKYKKDRRCSFSLPVFSYALLFNGIGQ